MKAWCKGGDCAAQGGEGVNCLNWVNALPRRWEAKPLRAVADYVVSNVDKVPADDEAPVRLCNYTDVYNNEFITLDLDFMEATATQAEIARFGMAVDDVIITKDSESWDDIAVPALPRNRFEQSTFSRGVSALQHLRQGGGNIRATAGK